MANQLTKICGIGLFGVLVSACGGSPAQEPQVPLSTPAPPAPAEANPPNAAAAQTTPADAADQPRATASNPAVFCRAIEDSSEIPIGCTFERLGDAPTMVLRFANAEVLQEALPVMLDGLVGPFCGSERWTEQGSGVVFVVARHARRLDCSTGQLGDWIELREQERQTITIGQACAAVASLSPSVTCELMDLDGIPSMVVGFDSRQNVEASVGALLVQVAGSFCQSAAQAEVRAGLVLLKDRSSARVYDCNTGQASAWFSVRPQRKTAPPNPAPKSTPRPTPPYTGGRVVLAGNGGWDLLRVQ